MQTQRHNGLLIGIAAGRVESVVLGDGDKAGGLMLLTFGNVRFHPTGDMCSETPRGPSWALAVALARAALSSI